jgi:hypothetical protein
LSEEGIYSQVFGIQTRIEEELKKEIDEAALYLPNTVEIEPAGMMTTD